MKDDKKVCFTHKKGNECLKDNCPYSHSESTYNTAERRGKGGENYKRNGKGNRGDVNSRGDYYGNGRDNRRDSYGNGRGSDSYGNGRDNRRDNYGNGRGSDSFGNDRRDSYDNERGGRDYRGGQNGKGKGGAGKQPQLNATAEDAKEPEKKHIPCRNHHSRGGCYKFHCDYRHGDKRKRTTNDNDKEDQSKNA